jgi:hypothetical protein
VSSIDPRNIFSFNFMSFHSDDRICCNNNYFPLQFVLQFVRSKLSHSSQLYWLNIDPFKIWRCESWESNWQLLKIIHISVVCFVYENIAPIIQTYNGTKTYTIFKTSNYFLYLAYSSGFFSKPLMNGQQR